MRKFKPTWDPLQLKQIAFSIPIENYLELLKDSTKAKMTVSDLLRSRLGYPTANELKEKRLKRNNPFFNN